MGRALSLRPQGMLGVGRGCCSGPCVSCWTPGSRQPSAGSCESVVWGCLHLSSPLKVLSSSESDFPTPILGHHQVPKGLAAGWAHSFGCDLGQASTHSSCSTTIGPTELRRGQSSHHCRYYSYHPEKSCVKGHICPRQASTSAHCTGAA